MNYNYVTISSAFLFFIPLCIENCSQSHPLILILIISSIIYKYNYLIYPNTKISYISTKFDHLCIMNVILFHFVSLSLYIKSLMRILTLVDYRYMYMSIGTLLIFLLVELFMTSYFLGTIMCISLFVSYLSYTDYLEKGWNMYNSWLWHYATTCVLLCVKLSYKNHRPSVF